MCHYHRVPGEIKRREVELDPQVSPEEIVSREVELGCESWTFSLQVVPQQQCNGHCPCDCPSTAVETAIAQGTSNYLSVSVCLLLLLLLLLLLIIIITNIIRAE